jgi:hypothetical protein
MKARELTGASASVEDRIAARMRGEPIGELRRTRPVREAGMVGGDALG